MFLGVDCDPDPQKWTLRCIHSSSFQDSKCKTPLRFVGDFHASTSEFCTGCKCYKYVCLCISSVLEFLIRMLQSTKLFQLDNFIDCLVATIWIFLAVNYVLPLEPQGLLPRIIGKKYNQILYLSDGTHILNRIHVWLNNQRVPIK